MDILQFIHSFIDEHVGCFLFGIIINQGAMKTY